MSISKQIILSSTLVGFLALFAGYMGWKNMNTISSEINNCMGNALEVSGSLQGIQGNLMQIHKWFLAEDKKEPLSSYLENFDQNINALGQLGNNVQEQLTATKMAYAGLHDKYQNQPGATFLDELRAVTFQGEKTLRSSHQSNREAIIVQSDTLHTNIKGLSFWIISICLAIFAMAIIFGQLIARALSKSLLSLENAAVQIRNGDLSTRVDINANNEFGYLAKSFNLLADSAEQSKIIEDQNQQLEDLNKELKVKNDSLDSFVYRVSHDLKAPLINIISLQKIIKSKIQEIADPAVHKSMNFMEVNSKRLHQTIHDLLEVSRIERDLNSDRQWTNIAKYIEEIKVENNEIITSSNTVIECDLQVKTVFFGKSNLRSILSNLITNSIKYRKAEGINKIMIKSYLENDYCCLELSDNGIGIDLEKHGKKLFGIFNRFHNHVDGSGVGLYIVKKIINENEGTIGIESEVGVGTTFKVKIPLPEKGVNKKEVNITLAEMNN